MLKIPYAIVEISKRGLFRLAGFRLDMEDALGVPFDLITKTRERSRPQD